MNVTAYIKTLIELCVSKKDIIAKISKECKMPEADVVRMYDRCIKELGH